MSAWSPFIIVAGGGLLWTFLCISAAIRWEKHDGPLSFAVIPVLLGLFVLVGIAEGLR